MAKTITQTFGKPDAKKGSVRFFNTAADKQRLITDSYIMRDAFKELFGVDLKDVEELKMTLEISGGELRMELLREVYDLIHKKLS